MNKEIELLIKKSTLKDVEIWLYQQYDGVDKILEDYLIEQYRLIDEELARLKEEV